MLYDGDKNRISMLVHHTYDNPIIPSLPFILANYLMYNPEKIPLYINDDLTLEDVLTKLHNSVKGNYVFSIMDELIKCVEGDTNE